MKTHDAHVSEQSQRDLAAGVLRQAARDLWWLCGRTSGVEGDLCRDAYHWLAVDEGLAIFIPNRLTIIESLPGKRAHDPMLVLNMSISNSDRGWNRIFNPLPQRENVWC
jgi:hypothetical protein